MGSFTTTTTTGSNRMTFGDMSPTGVAPLKGDSDVHSL